MGLIEGIYLGFSNALQPINVLWAFVGVSIGTLIGVLPGIGPAGAVAVLLPATLTVSPLSALILLAGIYYGAMYGGSTTSILLNIPGEAASVVTCLDGYQMARRGRAGPALGIAAFGSFIAGTFGVLMLMLLAPPLATLALRFGPPEFFLLMVLGLTLLGHLGGGSMVKALMMAAFGLILGLVGQDLFTGGPRLTYGVEALLDGLGLIPVVVGLFGLSEIMLNLASEEQRLVVDAKITGLMPNREDWRRSARPIARGSLLGFFIGLLPGAGAIISSFVSYAIERKLSRHPEEFGQGAIEGVAGPESANNAAAVGAMVPMLTLGVPPNPVMAVMLAALMIQGVTPGPLLIQKHPELFWGVIASMWIGNVLLLWLNLPAIGVWVRLLRVPYAVLFPLITLFTLLGAFGASGSVADVVIMIAFGCLGFALKKLDYEPAPLVLAFVIGPVMETAFRQSLILSQGSFLIFVTRPIAATFFVLTCMMLFGPLLQALWSSGRRSRREAVVLSKA